LGKQKGGRYTVIGVHPVKSWAILEAMGQTALYADVGASLKLHHSLDLKSEMVR
jgi:hypothetical protein